MGDPVVFSAYLAALTHLLKPAFPIQLQEVPGQLLATPPTTNHWSQIHTSHLCLHLSQLCDDLSFHEDSVQSLSHVQPCKPMECSRPDLLVHQSLLKLLSIKWVMPSNHLISTMSSPFAFNLSQHQGIFFLSGGYKYWSFSLSISPSSKYSGPISFRMDWFDLAVQGTQESSPTPQFKSINSWALSFL